MERSLTTQEVLTAAGEYKQVADWQQARQHALEICGEQARVVIVVKPEHDYREEYQGVHYVGIIGQRSELLWAGGIFPPREQTAFSRHILDNAPVEDENDSTEYDPFTKNNSIRLEYSSPTENEDQNLLSPEKHPFARAAANDDDPQRYLLFPPKDDIYRLDRPPAISYAHPYLRENDTSQHWLDYAEIAAYGQMYRTRYQWEEIDRLVRDTYGENALRVNITSYQQSDDEYGYYLLYSMGAVHDAHGNPLEPDPVLPIWQTRQFLEDYLDRCTYVTTSGVLRRDWDATARFFIDNQLDAIKGFTEVGYEFDLSVPPPVPPQIYVAND